jgi:hypothetical protein
MSACADKNDSKMVFDYICSVAPTMGCWIHSAPLPGGRRVPEGMEHSRSPWIYVFLKGRIIAVKRDSIGLTILLDAMMIRMSLCGVVSDLRECLHSTAQCPVARECQRLWEYTSKLLLPRWIW